MLKLEVKKLKAALSAKSDEVFGLENRKYQLQMSMEERKRQIEVHREVQRAQLKLAEEERHRVAMELQERLMKVTVLRAKFETLAARVRGSGDAGGEERSQAYFVIKAAQQREELQREGDELDAGIRKCEREIKALVATLKSLNVRNQVGWRGGVRGCSLTQAHLIACLRARAVGCVRRALPPPLCGWPMTRQSPRPPRLARSRARARRTTARRSRRRT